jgi:hypothetical protein
MIRMTYDAVIKEYLDSIAKNQCQNKACRTCSQRIIAFPAKA